MCGIAGIFYANNQEQASEPLLFDMIMKLIHRGPDAQQVISLPGVGLAHSRLSIIDLKAASNQPMTDEENGNVLVFNGEIYNYIELRQQLISAGHVFHTESDTEVILKAYACWGVECLNKFNGMWAFVLYDRQNQSVFAARDRLGIKPFIYGVNQQNDFIFASEAKAVIDIFPEFRQINQPFLINFVERDFFACFKETFYKNLFNLLPGHYFQIKHGEMPVQKRYWNWTPAVSVDARKDSDIIEQFKALLTDSIRLRFRSDVPVGSCLSGGMDSSTIVGMARGLFDKPMHTFSCIYPGTPEFDESFFINKAVKKFDTQARYTEPHYEDLISLMRTVTREQDGPTGGPSILSQRAVMELASQDVKVVLDGQGADELLGGYHSYFRYSLQSQVRGLREKFSLKKLQQYYAYSSQIKRRTGRRNGGISAMLYLTQSPAAFYTASHADTQLHYMQPFENDDLNTLLLEHVFTNLSNLLHYEDRNSMRFSIESRLPFLDYRLIEFAFSLTHHYKIRGGTTKWLLHNIAQDILPAEILSRKDKMGFSTPAHKWFMRTENLQFFSQYMNKNNAIFSALSPSMQSYLQQAFNSLQQQEKKLNSPAGAGDINALWRHFTANMWCESL